MVFLWLVITRGYWNWTPLKHGMESTRRVGGHHAESHRVMYGTRRNASKVEIPSSMNLWSSGYSHSQFLEAFQRQACGNHWSEGRTLKASPRELGPNRICWDGLGNDGTCPEKAWNNRLNFPGFLWNLLGTLTFDGSWFFFHLRWGRSGGWMAAPFPVEVYLSQDWTGLDTSTCGGMQQEVRMTVSTQLVNKHSYGK